MGTLSELAEEYKQNIDVLTSRIEILRKRYNTCRAKYGDCKQAFELNRDIAVTESMLSEQQQIYRTLKNYYKK